MIELVLLLTKNYRRKRFMKKLLYVQPSIEAYSTELSETHRTSDSQKGEMLVAIRGKFATSNLFSIFLPSGISKLDYANITGDKQCRFFETQLQQSDRSSKLIRPILMCWNLDTKHAEDLVSCWKPFVDQYAQQGLQAIHCDGTHIRAIFSGKITPLSVLPVDTIKKTLIEKGTECEQKIIYYSAPIRKFNFKKILFSIMILLSILVAVALPNKGASFITLTFPRQSNTFLNTFWIISILGFYYYLKINHLKWQAFQYALLCGSIFAFTLSSYIRYADIHMSEKEDSFIFTVLESTPAVYRGNLSNNYQSKVSTEEYRTTFKDEKNKTLAPISIKRQPDQGLISIGSSVRVVVRTGISGTRYLKKACLLEPALTGSENNCQPIILPKF